MNNFLIFSINPLFLRFSVSITEYISGPVAKCYIQKEIFETADTKLTWMDYSGYPKYKKMHEGLYMKCQYWICYLIWEIKQFYI